MRDLAQNSVNDKKTGHAILTGTITTLLVFLFVFGVFFPVTNADAIPTVTWDNVGNGGTHYLSDGAIGGVPTTITVDDPTIIGPGVDTINVTITSTSDPVGIPLTLTETGPLTHVFTNTNLIFLRNNTGQNSGGIPVPSDALINSGSTATITIFDTGTNADPSTIDMLPMLIQSTSDQGGIIPNFNETGINTSLFTGEVQFKSDPSSNNLLHVSDGDIVTIQDANTGISTNSLILPNPNPGIGAILAAEGDTVTATYQGISGSITIGSDGGSNGGGGGGLIITPGLVLDFLLGGHGDTNNISRPAFGGDPLLPYHDGLTINDKIFDISKYNNDIPQQTFEVNKNYSIRVKISGEYGNAIEHFGFFLIPKGKDFLTTNAEAWLNWDKPNELEIHDPQGYFKSMNVSYEPDGRFAYFTVHLVPVKPMPDQTGLLRTWDYKLNQVDTRLFGFMQIIDPNPSPKVEQIAPEQKTVEEIKPYRLDDDVGMYVLQTDNTWKHVDYVWGNTISHNDYNAIQNAKKEESQKAYDHAIKLGYVSPNKFADNRSQISNYTGTDGTVWILNPLGYYSPLLFKYSGDSINPYDAEKIKQICKQEEQKALKILSRTHT